MITSDSHKFFEVFHSLPVAETALTMRQALLVDPKGFRISSQSATDNTYMNTKLSVDLDLAFRQHQNVAETIKKLGVPVKVFPGVDGQDDGMYPNNVFAAMPGKFIIGKMFHPVRQAEATRQDVRQYFSKDLGYSIVDLSKTNGVGELTGALIIDHARKVGFVGTTNRADEAGVKAMHAAFGLKLTFCFPLTKNEYHTNILLSIFAGNAGVIYPGSIADATAADAIIRAYEGRLVIISEDEKNHFVANCLAITPHDILFSNTALRAMRPSTRGGLERFGLTLHGVDVSELEKGGGSLRCLIAEIF